MPQLERHIGLVGLTFIAIGGMLGAGWLFAPLLASQAAGPSALIAWVIAAGAMGLLAATFAEISGVLPVAGGIARLPHLTHGRTVSLAMGWSAWIGYNTAAPIEVEAILSYLKPQMPWLYAASGDLSAGGLAVALGALVILTILNAFGVKFFTRINNVMTWVKLALPVIVIALLVSADFNIGNFTQLPGGFAPDGMHGIFAAVSTGGVILSFLGFRHAIDMAGETRNPQRTVPLAIGLCMLLALLIYGGIQVAFIGALSPDDLAGGWAGIRFSHHMGPIAALLAAAGMIWLTGPLIAGAGLSAFGAAYVDFGSNGRLAMALARNGALPGFMKSVSRFGVPMKALLVNFAVSTLFFAALPFREIVALATASLVLTFTVGPIGVIALRRLIPDAKRGFVLPFAVPSAALAFAIATLVVYWGGRDTAIHLGATLATGLIVFAVMRWRHGADAMDLRQAAWLVPYLAGLFALCWVGSYGGGLGWLPRGWDIAIVTPFALACFALAVRSHLPEARFRRYLAEEEAHAGQFGV